MSSDVLPAPTLTGEEMVALCRRHTIYEWSAQSKVDPIPVARAEGVYFWTPEGKRYLDFNSQLMCSNIGHSHPRVVRAIQEQAAVLAYANPFMATEPRARLGAKLAEITPGRHRHLLLHERRGRGQRERDPHRPRGDRAPQGAWCATARTTAPPRGRSPSPATRAAGPRSPRIPGIVRAPDFHKWGRREPEPLDACLRELEDVIRYEGGANIAAFVMEPVVGTNGILIPPDGYMKAVRELCDRHGILLIADEVMSGFGRTGRWFAVDHWGVVPDLITDGQGPHLGLRPARRGGHARRRSPRPSRTGAFPGGLTYNSHPLACATALATIAVYEEEGLVENAERMGKVLRQRMIELEKKHPSVGATRSIGLFGIFELVRDRRTYEPMAPYNGTLRGDGGPRALLPRAGPLHLRALEHLLHEPAPHHRPRPRLDEGLAIVDRGLEITDRAVKA